MVSVSPCLAREQASMSQLDNIATLAQQLEANEIAAWRAIFGGPPAPLAAHLGSGYLEQGRALMIWNRAARVPLFNRIVGLGLFEPATDDLIDGLLARARAEHIRILVHVAPVARPANLGAMLSARGLVPAQPWLVHYRSLETPLPAPRIPEGYRIERTLPASSAAWGDALLAAWGFSDRAAVGALAVTLPIVQDAHTICFAAIHEASGQIAGAAMLYVSGSVGGLYADGVRQEHRQQGLQDALIAVRLAEAQRQGCTLACSQTLEAHPAQRNMAQAGFEIAYTRENYIPPK